MQSRDKIIAGTDELADGEMKEVTVDGQKLLLVRCGDDYHTTVANCPHYGAPLAQGALNGTRVVCPWHHAVFDVASGALKEPPAIDGIHVFETRVLGDNVVTRLPEKVADERPPEMATHDMLNDQRVFVIVGAGAAGYMAAQTLREYGFTGRLVVVSRENRFPYDRPNLSKDYLAGEMDPDWMPLRSHDFYREHDIELLLGTEVTPCRSDKAVPRVCRRRANQLRRTAADHWRPAAPHRRAGGRVGEREDPARLQVRRPDRGGRRKSATGRDGGQRFHCPGGCGEPA